MLLVSGKRSYSTSSSYKAVINSSYIGQTVLAVVSTYVPQQGLEDNVEYKFYDELLATTLKFNAREIVIIAGDLNGHVGKALDGYESIHCGRGFRNRNTEGERILEFYDTTEMVKSSKRKELPAYVCQWQGYINRV